VDVVVEQRLQASFKTVVSVVAQSTVEDLADGQVQTDASVATTVPCQTAERPATSVRAIRSRGLSLGEDWMLYE